MELLKQFLPEQGATMEHHEIFADFLEDRGEMNMASSMRRHGKFRCEFTRECFERCPQAFFSAAERDSWRTPEDTV